MPVEDRQSVVAQMTAAAGVQHNADGIHIFLQTANTACIRGYRCFPAVRLPLRVSASLRFIAISLLNRRRGGAEGEK